MLADQLYYCFCLYSFSGLCIPSSYVGLKWPRWYHLYTTVSDIVVFLNAITILANILTPGVPLSKRCYSGFTLLASVESLAKLIVCHRFERRFCEYLKRWDDLIEQDCDGELKKAKLKDTNSTKRLTKWLFVVMVAPMIPWGSLPLFIKWLSYVMPALRTTYRFIAVPAQFPFDSLISPNFEMVTIFQGIAAVFVNGKITAYDCMLYGLLSCQIVQLKHLKKSLSDTFSLEISDDMAGCNCADLITVKRERLNNWVVRHTHFISLARSLNELYSPVLLVKFFFEILILCLAAFVVSSATVTKLEIAFTLIYITTTIFQLYMLCWLGEEITSLSVSLTEEAFWQEWFCPAEVCTSFKIIMEKTKVPVKISAYGTFHLSVETFKSVIKTAYSYYMFLNGIKRSL